MLKVISEKFTIESKKGVFVDYFSGTKEQCNREKNRLISEGWRVKYVDNRGENPTT
jgi:hypothetical protein